LTLLEEIRESQSTSDKYCLNLSNENSSGSNWWKTVKQLTGIKSRDHEIPPLVKNDNLIFDDIEKAMLGLLLLKTGETLYLFHWLGKIACCKDMLNNLHRGFLISMYIIIYYKMIC
jgi:hypothetical protein